MTFEEAVKLIKENSHCPDCGHSFEVVVRQPIGGWAAYLYCVNDECPSPGPYDRISWWYGKKREDAEAQVISFATSFVDEPIDSDRAIDFALDVIFDRDEDDDPAIGWDEDEVPF